MIQIYNKMPSEGFFGAVEIPRLEVNVADPEFRISQFIDKLGITPIALVQLQQDVTGGGKRFQGCPMQ